MSVAVEMPKVSQCSIVSCAYNHNGCHAYAITVAEGATCATFVESTVQGGVDALGFVGACQQGNCKHNMNLECRAPAIEVGAAKADCQTFEPK